MINPVWLIEDFDPDDSRIKLIEIVRKHNIDCQVVKYLPFESGSYNLIPDNSDQCVIFQGSLNLARQLRREKKWIPGVWCNLDNFKRSMYYPYFGEYLLNRDYNFIPVFDLKRRKDELYHKFGWRGCLFICPDSGFKTFSGKVVKFEEFDADYEWMKEFSNRDSMALISTPKYMSTEYRFVICNKKVITGSVYRKSENLEYNPLNLSHGRDIDAFNYAQARCSIDWEPDPIYIMDVCNLSSARYRHPKFEIIELNSFSCSGLYACDLDIVVEKATELAIKENEEYRDDEVSKLCAEAGKKALKQIFAVESMSEPKTEPK